MKNGKQIFKCFRGQSESLVRRLSLIGLTSVALLASACTDADHDTIQKACIQAAGASTNASLSSTCDCVARGAHRYLDAKNYALLVRTSAIAMSSQGDIAKLRQTTALLIQSGESPSKAATMAIDFIFLTEKLNRECRSAS